MRRESDSAVHFGKLVRGELVARENRFRALVRLEGHEVRVHVPNSGRLRELLTPQRAVWLSPAGRPGRKTAFDLALVEMQQGLVSIDARLPNLLVAEAMARGALPWAEGSEVRREVRRGDSRLDLLLTRACARCWIEVKSVTLVNDGTAMFPDAPTTRGVRHVQELTRAAAQGDAARVIFVVQREDAVRFRPFVENDPDLAAAVLDAQSAGVQVQAYRCQVALDEIRLADELPVVLPEHSSFC